MSLLYPPGLLDALENVEVAAVDGVVWRQILLPTAVLRANIRGGRWNPHGVEALYSSVDPAAAAAEIDNLIAQQPVPITRPRTTYDLTVHISQVGDLRPAPTGPGLAWDYGPTETSDCQQIGAAAAWLGFGGLLVPSVRHNTTNLVIFMTNLAADDHIDIGHDDGFPHPPGPPPELEAATLTLHQR